MLQESRLLVGFFFMCGQKSALLTEQQGAQEYGGGAGREPRAGRNFFGSFRVFSLEVLKRAQGPRQKRGLKKC